MKLIIRISIACISILMVMLSAFSVFAKTIYVLNGYSYSIINNDSVSLCGWDNSTGVLTVPDSIGGRFVTNISENGFAENVELTKLDFSQTTKLETIGYYAFCNCTGISNEVVIPSTVKVIGFNAFQNCSSMPGVVINGDVKYIQQESFRGCSFLQNVTINGNTQIIEQFAFADCPLLEHVDIPVSVTRIDSSAFYNDTNLTLGVWYGTAGYDFAVAQNIPYILLDGVKLGDASGDGSVNINDVTTIQRYLAELETLEGIYLHAADANQDGTVDIADATIIQMFLAEYEMEYPIGEVMTQ